MQIGILEWAKLSISSWCLLCKWIHTCIWSYRVIDGRELLLYRGVMLWTAFACSSVLKWCWLFWNGLSSFLRVYVCECCLYQMPRWEDTNPVTWSLLSLWGQGTSFAVVVLAFQFTSIRLLKIRSNWGHGTQCGNFCCSCLCFQEMMKHDVSSY